jgi:DNA-directed RNA polymerase II subunit RPB2
VIVGKVVQVASNSTDVATTARRRDSSLYARKNEVGVVDAVMYTTDPTQGTRVAKVRVRSMRTPQVGDKFSSRHGQKGTCGMLYQQEDMPFTAQGVVPDLIMNPHAIPSRMTIGQLIECLCGKVAAATGNEADSTPFTKMSVESVCAHLHERGFQQRGNDVFYNGHTGRRMAAQVFFGPTYYQVGSRF